MTFPMIARQLLIEVLNFTPASMTIQYILTITAGPVIKGTKIRNVINKSLTIGRKLVAVFNYCTERVLNC